MKRLGIFVFYDKDGIVDPYVEYLLSGIMPQLSRLVIVCNGKITDEGKEKLSAFSEEIHVRENTGFDAMAYKLAMTEYLGWAVVDQYDEVLLFNDTFYGPIYPFSEMFEKMNAEDCDFWGVTYQNECRDYMFGTSRIIPSHVHTYLCVYRKSAVMSKAFRNYWNNFDSTSWFFSDVCRHEMEFTDVLVKGGLKWKTYIDLPMNQAGLSLTTSVNPYYAMAYEIIKKYRCPILKRKNFIIKNLSNRTGNAGEDTRHAFDYIAKKTDYDTNLIWNNILRLYNLYEIKNALHLDYILPYENVESVDKRKCREALIVYQDVEQDAANELYEYFDAISEQFVLRRVERWEEFLDVVKTEAPAYKYLCVIRLEDITQDIPYPVVKSANYNLIENTIKSCGYVDRVLELFNTNERLGVLSVPPIVHGNAFSKLSDFWNGRYDNVETYLTNHEIKVNVAPETPCVSSELGTWCRVGAIRQIFETRITEINGEEFLRVLPYIAQANGFFSGTVMNVDYASLQHTNVSYELSNAVKKMHDAGAFTDYPSFLNAITECKINGYQNIVIYGAGANGTKAASLLTEKGYHVKGLIISDDQPAQTEKDGWPIYRLSDYTGNTDDTIIIVSVAHARSRDAIVRNLREKGYKYILW